MRNSLPCSASISKYRRDGSQVLVKITQGQTHRMEDHALKKAEAALLQFTQSSLYHSQQLTNKHSNETKAFHDGCYAAFQKLLHYQSSEKIQLTANAKTQRAELEKEICRLKNKPIHQAMSSGDRIGQKSEPKHSGLSTATAVLQYSGTYEQRQPQMRQSKGATYSRALEDGVRNLLQATDQGAARSKATRFGPHIHAIFSRVANGAWHAESTGSSQVRRATDQLDTAEALRISATQASPLLKSRRSIATTVQGDAIQHEPSQSLGSLSEDVLPPQCSDISPDDLAVHAPCLKPIREWSHAQVQAFVYSIPAIRQYSELFFHASFDGPRLMDLCEWSGKDQHDQLLQLGIMDTAHRTHFLQKAAELAAQHRVLCRPSYHSTEMQLSKIPQRTEMNSSPPYAVRSGIRPSIRRLSSSTTRSKRRDASGDADSQPSEVRAGNQLPQVFTNSTDLNGAKEALEPSQDVLSITKVAEVVDVLPATTYTRPPMHRKTARHKAVPEHGTIRVKMTAAHPTPPCSGLEPLNDINGELEVWAVPKPLTVRRR